MNKKLMMFLVCLGGLCVHLPAEREILISGDLLLLPVTDRNKINKEDPAGPNFGMLEVFVGEQLIHRVHAVYPKQKEEARFWAFLDMKEYKGQRATLKLSGRGLNETHSEKVLSWMESSDTMRHVQPVYQESLRPQFHFSQIQGWNNDPNGMFYADGLYHLSWQCNPTETYFGGWYWGHAVSEDLIHWREAPRTLRANGSQDTNRYPGMGDGKIFSGGAAIDWNNTLGKQVGDQKTIIATFTDNPFGESIAYSTDGGFRYTSMEDINPIIIHPIPEGAKGRGSWGRDPKPFWHQPSQTWVIVTYRQGFVPSACSGHMAFYTSKDLKTWEFASMTEKIFPEEYEKKEDRQDQYKKDWHECPELLELPVDGDPTNKKWVLLDAILKYQIGSFDGKTFTPDEKDYKWNMFGEMKAGQAFSNAPEGRAIFMVWVQKGFGDDAPFNQGFTLPLELTLRTAEDGIRLYTNPVKELEKLRAEEIFSVKGAPLGAGAGVSFDTNEELLEVLISVKTDAGQGQIELTFGENKLFYYLDQRRLGDRGFIQHEGRKVFVHDREDGRIDFRLYLDRATWEIFVENGSVYQIGSRKENPQGVTGISVNMKDAVGELESMQVFKLKSIWPETVDRLIYPEDLR